MPFKNIEDKRLWGQRYYQTHPEYRAYKKKHGRGRKRNRCQYQKKWFKEHKEKKKAYSANYRHHHAKAIQERKHAYYLKNRERLLQKQKRWYEANRNRSMEASSAYQKQHKCDVNALHRKWYRKNLLKAREARRIYARKYYHNNRAVLIARAIEATGRRRQWMNAGVEDIAAIRRWMRDTKANPSTTCSYCGAPATGKNLHFDHYIPLMRGGRHCLENLKPSCATCNISKRDRTPEEWDDYRAEVNIRKN